MGQDVPALGKARHLVAMTHPHLSGLALGKTVEQIAVVVDDDFCFKTFNNRVF